MVPSLIDKSHAIIGQERIMSSKLKVSSSSRYYPSLLKANLNLVLFLFPKAVKLLNANGSMDLSDLALPYIIFLSRLLSIRGKTNLNAS